MDIDKNGVEELDLSLFTEDSLSEDVDVFNDSGELEIKLDTVLEEPTLELDLGSLNDEDEELDLTIMEIEYEEEELDLTKLFDEGDSPDIYLEDIENDSGERIDDEFTNLEEISETVGYLSDSKRSEIRILEDYLSRSLDKSSKEMGYEKSYDNNKHQLSSVDSRNMFINIVIKKIEESSREKGLSNVVKDEIILDIIQITKQSEFTLNDLRDNSELRGMYGEISMVYDFAISVVTETADRESEQNRMKFVKSKEIDKYIEGHRQFQRRIKEEDVTLVKEIYFDSVFNKKIDSESVKNELENSIKFKCGSCGEIVSADNMFYKINDVDKRITSSDKIIMSVLYNDCDKCGYANVLPKDAVVKLKEFITEKYLTKNGNVKPSEGTKQITHRIGERTLSPSVLSEVLKGSVDVIYQFNELEFSNDNIFNVDKYRNNLKSYVEDYNTLNDMFKIDRKIKGNKKDRYEYFRYFISEVSDGSTLTEKEVSKITLSVVGDIMKSNLFNILSKYKKDLDKVEESEYSLIKYKEVLLNIIQNNNKGIMLREFTLEGFERMQTNMENHGVPVLEVFNSKGFMSGEYDAKNYEDTLKFIDNNLESLRGKIVGLRNKYNNARSKVLDSKNYEYLLSNSGYVNSNALENFYEIVGKDEVSIGFVERVVDSNLTYKNIVSLNNYIKSNPSMSKKVNKYVKEYRDSGNYDLGFVENFVSSLNVKNLINKTTRGEIHTRYATSLMGYKNQREVLKDCSELFKAFKQKNYYRICDVLEGIDVLSFEKQGIDVAGIRSTFNKSNLDNYNKYLSEVEMIVELDGLNFKDEDVLKYFKDKDLKEYRRSNYPVKESDVESIEDYFNRIKGGGTFNNTVKKMYEDIIIDSYIENDWIERMSYMYGFNKNFIGEGEYEYYRNKAILEIVRYGEVNATTAITGVSTEIISKIGINMVSLSDVVGSLTDKVDSEESLESYLFRGETMSRMYKIRDNLRGYTYKDILRETGLKLEEGEPDLDIEEITQLYKELISELPKFVEEGFEDDIKDRIDWAWM